MTAALLQATALPSASHGTNLAGVKLVVKACMHMPMQLYHNQCHYTLYSAVVLALVLCNTGI